MVEDFDGVILRVKVNEDELNRFGKDLSESTPLENKELDNNTLSKESGPLSDEILTTKTTTVPLMDENLRITKIVEDSINITKESVKETKTIEIDLMRETITIERRQPVVDSNNNASLNDSLRTIESGPEEPTTQISIPLKREEPVITKKPYVKKEVTVKKKPITEPKTITGEVTHEELRKI